MSEAQPDTPKRDEYLPNGNNGASACSDDAAASPDLQQPPSPREFPAIATTFLCSVNLRVQHEHSPAADPQPGVFAEDRAQGGEGQRPSPSAPGTGASRATLTPTEAALDTRQAALRDAEHWRRHGRWENALEALGPRVLDPHDLQATPHIASPELPLVAREQVRLLSCQPFVHWYSPRRALPPTAWRAYSSAQLFFPLFRPAANTHSPKRLPQLIISGARVSQSLQLCAGVRRLGAHDGRSVRRRGRRLHRGE